MTKPAVVDCLTYVASPMEWGQVGHTEQILTLRDLSHQCVVTQLEPYFINTKALSCFLTGVDIHLELKKK